MTLMQAGQEDLSAWISHSKILGVCSCSVEDLIAAPGHSLKMQLGAAMLKAP